MENQNTEEEEKEDEEEEEEDDVGASAGGGGGGGTVRRGTDVTRPLGLRKREEEWSGREEEEEGAAVERGRERERRTHRGQMEREGQREREESNPPPRRRRRRAVSVALDIPLAAPLFPSFSRLSRSLTASDCFSLSLPPRGHFASFATFHPSSSSPTVRSPTSPSSLCDPVEDSRESSSSARPKFTRRDRDPRRRRR